MWEPGEGTFLLKGFPALLAMPVSLKGSPTGTAPLRPLSGRSPLPRIPPFPLPRLLAGGEAARRAFVPLCVFGDGPFFERNASFSRALSWYLLDQQA